MKPKTTRWLAAVFIVVSPLYFFSFAAFPARPAADPVMSWVFAAVMSTLFVSFGVFMFRNPPSATPRFAMPAQLTEATIAAIAERARQIHVKGYTRQHDADLSDSAELAQAAAFYAMADLGHEQGRVRWPWDKEACKVKDRYDNYVRAAALLIAAADLELARGGGTQLGSAPRNVA